MRDIDRDRRAGEAGVGGDAVEEALEFADVVLSTVDEEPGDLRDDLDPLFEGFALQDRQTGLLVRRLDIGDEPPLEAGAEAVFEAGDRPRLAVAGEDDLAAVSVEVVEGVEELLLGAVLAGEELDVVDEEDLRRAVAAAELVLAALGDGGDEVFGELLAGDVEGATLRDGEAVGYRLEEVGLAETWPAVDEQRVVTGAGLVGGGDGGGRRQAVGLADDEALKGELGVELFRAVGAGGDRAQARRSAVEGREIGGVAVAIAVPIPVAVRPHDLELQADRPSNDGAYRLGDDRAHLCGQPLAHEVRGRTDDEGAVLGAQAHGVLQPGVEVRAGNLQLKLAQGGFPYTVGGRVLHKIPSLRRAEQGG